MMPRRPTQLLVRRVAIASLAVFAVAAMTAHGARAQDANPLGQPLLDERGEIRDDAFIQIPLRPDDQQYADIRGDRLKDMLMEVDAISLRDRDRGNLFWGRNVGTQGHVDTQDWVEEYFRRNGLVEIERESFDLDPQWKLNSWDIGFSGPGGGFELESARPAEDAESTPAQGLEFELVWIGTGAEADYIGRDVQGKAVLILDIPWPGTLRHSIAIEGSVGRAFEHGAAAVGIVYGISDNFAVWQRVAGGPGFNVGYEDGMRLRDMLGRGERVTVNLRLDAEQVPGLEAAHVWGTLPGLSEEEVLIIAHMDGFFQAALDNGTGLAVMMGLLEHYARLPRAQRPRTIRFLGSVGHHSGPGTSGLHDEAATALANTVLAINLEHVAVARTKYWGPELRKMNAVSPMRWWVWGSQDLLDVVLDSFNRFNVGVTGDMETGASGEMGRMARDVPTIQVITSPEIKHTEQDTPEWIPAVGLEQIARAYARIIDGVNTLERSELQPAGGMDTTTDTN
jgi:Peptidase family M28